MSATLFTCRHTFEATLCVELARLGVTRTEILLPGLVLAPESARDLDPVYALQVLPDAQLIQGASIRELSLAAREVALPVLQAGEGPWDLHTIVPGMLKGTPKPPMARRAALIAEAMLADLRKDQRAIWRRRQEMGSDTCALVQLLLLDNEAAWVSAAPVRTLPPLAAWPCRVPAGLAVVADDDVAPASSYRKLLEAITCMGMQPLPGQQAVDLGASPGGWTHVLRRAGAHVTAVDRAPLAPHLMRDPQVRFVTGDAFAWRPEAQVDWLVSDIIAFPERVAELLQAWCGGHLAKHMIVQMKFRGEPDWLALQAALDVARTCGYATRAKHFFNDKNEVTLMLTVVPHG